MKNKAIILVLLVLTAFPAVSSAQKLSLGTNLIDWADFGTPNLELNVAVHQHFSIMVGGRYNSWDFHSKDPAMLVRNHQQTAYAGFRYWPWYVNSGWWIATKAQWMNYSNTGIWRPALHEGMGVGAGISAGYTWMLMEHLNLELGAGAWGGYLIKHALYCCPECMEVRQQGPKGFIYPDDLFLSIVYVF